MTIEEKIKSGMSVEDIVSEYSKEVAATKSKLDDAAKHEQEMKDAEAVLVDAFANYYRTAGFDDETITKVTEVLTKDLEADRPNVKPIKSGDFQVKTMSAKEFSDFLGRLIDNLF